MTKEDLSALMIRLEKAEARANYLLDEFLTVAGRLLKAEKEADELFEKLSAVAANTPMSPRECYRCGSCDVVSAWFKGVYRRSPGLGTQSGTIIVWYCAKHEPQDKDTEK